MKTKDLIVGEIYRHIDSPYYCFAKVIKILKPNQEENITKKTLVKCLWSQDKDFNFCITKYFKPIDLIKIK